MRSLRVRLLLAGVAGVAVSAVAVGGLLGAAFERSALHALDRRLDADLNGLIGLAEWGAGGRLVMRREPADERYQRVFSGSYWQVSAPGQRYQSRSLWDMRLAEADDSKRSYRQIAGPSMQRLRVASQAVRLPDGWDAAKFSVAADLTEVHVEVREFRWLAASAMALVTALLSIAMSWQIGYGLRPLNWVGHRLRRIQSGSASRFDANALPHEVAPLALQINELLDEHARQVERARNTAQDLAHALKTPLAVLSIECERPSEMFVPTVAEQVERMRAIVDRRLNGSIGGDSRQHTAVEPVLQELRRYFLQAYRARAVIVDLEIATAITFRGAAEDLEEMAGNLLDNACKWAGRRVRVCALASRSRCWQLIVEDDGPGLTRSQSSQVLERGVRLDHRVPGSGLGLAIADDIAMSYGGRLSLHASELGGLRAVLELPAQE